MIAYVLPMRKLSNRQKKSAARGKRLYDSRTRQASIQVGDLVLVGILVLVECIPGLPVYKVQEKVGEERVLHHNLSLPFRGEPSVPAAGCHPVRPKQPVQFTNRTADSCCDV